MPTGTHDAMVGVAEPDRRRRSANKPKLCSQSIEPAFQPSRYIYPKRIAAKSIIRARKKALQDELNAILARYGLTLAQFVEGVNSGRIQIVVGNEESAN